MQTVIEAMDSKAKNNPWHQEAWLRLNGTQDLKQGAHQGKKHAVHDVQGLMGKCSLAFFLA